MTDRYLDTTGAEIVLGARVMLAGEHPIDEACGVVERLIEPDLDQHPAVAVLFDDGETDTFPATPRHHDDDWRCADLQVIA
jgi:hypothetical protein